MRKERRRERICSSKCRFLNLSIEAWQRIPSSSSSLPLSLSKTNLKLSWKMEIGIGVNWVLQNVQIHHIIKAKQQTNAREDEKPRENGKVWSNTRTHGRACKTHNRAPPTTGRGGLCPVWSRSFFNAAFWCTFWAACLAFVGSFWASFASFFDHLGLLTSSNYMFLSL